jgi:hypothetical protein
MPETPRRTEPYYRWLLVTAGLVVVVFGGLPGRQKHQDARPAMAAGRQEQAHQNPLVAYEPSDWPLGLVAWVYPGVVALLVICCMVLIVAYPNSLPDVGRDVRIAPPGPRLQTNAEADLEHFRADEQKRLDTYYWVDRKNGAIHIPIDRAMKALVQTGIPGFPQGAP